MKVLVRSKQVGCPAAAESPKMLGGRRGARGGHGEGAETGQLQPECSPSASKPLPTPLAVPLPPIQPAFKRQQNGYKG